MHHVKSTVSNSQTYFTRPVSLKTLQLAARRSAQCKLASTQYTSLAFTCHAAISLFLSSRTAYTHTQHTSSLYFVSMSRQIRQLRLGESYCPRFRCCHFVRRAFDYSAFSSRIFVAKSVSLVPSCSNGHFVPSDRIRAYLLCVCALCMSILGIATLYCLHRTRVATRRASEAKTFFLMERTFSILHEIPFDSLLCLRSSHSSDPSYGNSSPATRPYEYPK